MSEPRDPADAVGLAVREAFVGRRRLHLSVVDPGSETLPVSPVWDGGPDGRGVARKAVWPGLGRFALDRRLDVGQWVDTLFSLTYMFDHVPTPNDLRHPQVLKGLATAAERLRGDVVYRTEAEVSAVLTRLHHAAATSALPEAKVYKTVLCHPGLEASAVVRYVLAVRYGLADVAAAFAVPAALQYGAHPDWYADALYKWPGAPASLADLLAVFNRLRAEGPGGGGRD